MIAANKKEYHFLRLQNVKISEIVNVAEQMLSEGLLSEVDGEMIIWPIDEMSELF
jgi:RNA-binding protein YhbY